ncbi:MAG: MarR family transcriptional regulator [Zetaproteobacteria bacterium]|nr:MarR family transcriptional regulator [Zetaproteobacteria bacterium]
MKDIVKGMDDGLSPIQIMILRILAEEGELSQAMLVKKMGKNKSQITRLLHELEKKGLIIKEPNKEDGRSFMLKTIDDVKNKVSLFIQHEEKIVSDMLRGIQKRDLQKLDSLLIKMQNNLNNAKKHNKSIERDLRYAPAPHADR